MFTVSKDEIDKTVGNYVVFFVNGPQVGKVLEIDHDKEEVVWEALGGDRNGKKFRSRYDVNVEDLEVYPPGEETNALLKTDS